jgi:hypothetical protein
VPERRWTNLKNHLNEPENFPGSVANHVATLINYAARLANLGHSKDPVQHAT